jgi:hypothetical protein
MKKILSFSALILVLATAFVACKKDKETNPSTNNNNNNTTACNGKNLCMKLDGTQISQDAKWKSINNTRTRIYWEEGSGNNYKNIELDIYGSAAGTYAVAAKPSAGQAGFQYYVNDNNGTKNIVGQSGEVKVTSTTNNTYTGTFTITATDDAGKTYQITEGNFVSVPQ